MLVEWNLIFCMFPYSCGYVDFYFPCRFKKASCGFLGFFSSLIVGWFFVFVFLKSFGKLALQSFVLICVILISILILSVVSSFQNVSTIIFINSDAHRSRVCSLCLCFVLTHAPARYIFLDLCRAFLGYQ